MSVMTRVADKAGALGSIVSAMGCGSLLPGPGQPWRSTPETRLLEPVSGSGTVTVLLPLFAALALLANALGWFNHRQWHRSVLGMVGPAIVLVASFTVAEKLLYVGLATMVAVSVWDFVSPANRRCGPDGCAVPPKHA